LIDESLVGVSVAVTLQKANGADTVIIAVPLLAVVWKGAVISVADVIVPLAMGRPTSAEQDVTAATVGAVLTMTHVNIVANRTANPTCLISLTAASLS